MKNFTGEVCLQTKAAGEFSLLTRVLNGYLAGLTPHTPDSLVDGLILLLNHDS